MLFTKVSLALAVSPAIALAATYTCDSAHISLPVVPGAKITSFTVAEYVALNYCQINVTLTHPGTNDSVNNQVLLPLKGWNGRFLGTGGGGYSAGYFSALPIYVSLGYAAVATDAGHTQADAFSADTWALASTGNVNQYNLLDFASRSVHDMTVLGKQITTCFYQTAIKYSYWDGCSTGGRQGYMEAQMYPDDYDGIMASAPAINWNSFTPAQQWPNVVVNNAGYYPYSCELDAINVAVTAACDNLDGFMDGVISAPELCHFNLSSLVGKSFQCADDGSTKTFQAKTAAIVAKIWEGPRTLSGKFLWYGLEPGANFTSFVVTKIVNGTNTLTPFGISDSWFRDFLFKNVTYDTRNISYAEFPSLFYQSHREYDSVIGTQVADLSAFKAGGKKMITWQGLADTFIFPQGTANYYDRVAKLFPDVHDFYRVFFAPGVGHCQGGPGAIPTDPLGALRAWVENGTAPDTLNAIRQQPLNGTLSQQNLCPYPLVSKYKGGQGAVVATSFECVAHF